MKTLIVILGPTAVGKTETCLSLAESLHLPIISADSRQIYKGIPIGTATPNSLQQARVKHYMVECLNLADYYNAAMYEQDVLALLKQLFNDSDIALMSGGSMMYIDAVCNGMGTLPTVSPELRQKMKERLQSEGLQSLCDELQALDPEYYQIVDTHNYRRVIHALEIIHTTGSTFSSLRTGVKKQRPFRIVKIGLIRPRQELYQRINNRVDEMITQGLETEARSVYHLKETNALNTVGYKELFEYFEGRFSLQEAIERIKGNTRRYCRKQLTWFKRDPDVKWIDISQSDNEQILEQIRRILQP